MRKLFNIFRKFFGKELLLTENESNFLLLKKISKLAKQGYIEIYNPGQHALHSALTNQSNIKILIIAIKQKENQKFNLSFKKWFDKEGDKLK